MERLKRERETAFEKKKENHNIFQIFKIFGNVFQNRWRCKILRSRKHNKSPVGKTEKKNPHLDTLSLNCRTSDKWKEILCSHSKSANQMKITKGFFLELQKPILTYTRRRMWPRLTKTILKNEVGVGTERGGHLVPSLSQHTLQCC